MGPARPALTRRFAIPDGIKRFAYELEIRTSVLTTVANSPRRFVAIMVDNVAAGTVVPSSDVRSNA